MTYYFWLGKEAEEFHLDETEHWYQYWLELSDENF